MALPPSRPSLHGRGRAVLRALGRDPVFSELSYTYPLKLLSPKLHSTKSSSIVYILSYGGGLVSDDCVELAVDVGAGASMICLTQGSTKIFRVRGQKDRIRASNIQSTTLRGATSQQFEAKVASNASLFLLPDPVTCFASSSYNQIQTFHLESSDSSAIVLDWFTSGRMYRGEEWLFDRYRSTNEIFINKSRVARDVMLLENPTESTALSLPLAKRPLKDRLAPYSCYATMFLFGPQAATIIANLEAELKTIRQFQNTAPPPLIWSFSNLSSQEWTGGIIRAASMETQTLKTWLKKTIAPTIELIGQEAYDKIFL